jgi:uncharacterized metal-binding protein
MPSGRTHDALTFLLAVPAFGVAFLATRSVTAAGVIAVAFVFGGLMFGPDLDTVSRQYSRWGPLRLLWFPYRSFFSHRSRFSHGLIFGALIRVIYFMGVLTIVLYLGAYAYASIVGGRLIGIFDTAHVWQPVGEFTRQWMGANFLALTFVGLWLGAASHTFTDVAGSYVKTGRVTDLL